MNILPYKPLYRDQCLAIFNSNRPKYFDISELPTFINWLDHYADENYFVVEQDGEIIGCGGIFYESDKNTGGLSWGMVHAKEQGKGYGKLFTKHRIGLFRTRFPGAALQLNTSQHTVTFYEKMGFRVISVKPDGYSVGLDRYDMVAEG
jgi:predicted GNAT family N-acyltransferase